jgi:hypothetical protein
MSDPETMKVLTNPDNLRALADAPGLIEQDFANPNWEPPTFVEPPLDLDDDVHDDDGIVSPDGAGTTVLLLSLTQMKSQTFMKTLLLVKVKQDSNI